MWRILAALVMAAVSGISGAGDEISLFGHDGKVAAYIDDDLAIYLVSGRAVAYIEPYSAGGFHIYGFNGMHLGWYVRGIARDRQGRVVCVAREMPQFAGQKPGGNSREIPPPRNSREPAPALPQFTRDWAKSSCESFLSGRPG